MALFRIVTSLLSVNSWINLIVRVRPTILWMADDRWSKSFEMSQYGRQLMAISSAISLQLVVFIIVISSSHAIIRVSSDNTSSCSNSARSVHGGSWTKMAMFDPSDHIDIRNIVCPSHTDLCRVIVYWVMIVYHWSCGFSCSVVPCRRDIGLRGNNCAYGRLWLSVEPCDCVRRRFSYCLVSAVSALGNNCGRDLLGCTSRFELSSRKFRKSFSVRSSVFGGGWYCSGRVP